METVKKLYERGVANGVPGISLLNGEEVRALEGRVSDKVVGALRCTSSGIVCPYGLTIAAIGNAMDNGAELIYDFPVDNIKQTENSYTIHAGERYIEADYIINSAGMYADKIATMLGDEEYHIIPKKGEYMLLDRAEGDLCSHTLFQVPTAAGKGVLVSPTADGNLLVGPTSVAIDDRECRDTTIEGLDYVKEAAGKSVADIPYRQTITSFTGVRAALEGEEDFVIEASKSSPRAINLLGIDSPGLSSAPAIALEVVSMLKNAGLVLCEKNDFNGTRASYHDFRDLSDEEKNEKIKTDPRYGHMICRCETITEGEIREAIRRNPPARTMDAVKRRIRAGMGRCQGGFCTTYVAEMVAEENAMAVTDVTKFGPGSELLHGMTRGGN
jgi:glycerol-3-phosphate dehydrogenase